MSKLNINSPAVFATTLYNLCTQQPNFGLYPHGFAFGRIITYGPKGSELAPRKPLPAVDGSPRGIFRTNRPDTVRGILEGMSFFSTEESERGLFKEVYALESALNIGSRSLIERVVPDGVAISDLRPGLDDRMARYGNISIRDIIRKHAGAGGISPQEDISGVAQDIAVAADRGRGRSQFVPEAIFLSAAIFAAMGDEYKENAISLFAESAAIFMQDRRDNAAAMVAEHAAYKAGGYPSIDGRNSIGQMIAMAWKDSAREFAGTDKVGSMIARFRGLHAAIATGAWAEAGALFGLDAEANSGIERGKGFARAAWAVSRRIIAENENSRWPHVEVLLDKAREEWNGSDEMRGARETMKALSSTARGWSEE